MNYPLLFRLLSLILVALVFAFSASLGIGLLYGEWEAAPHAIQGFIVSIGVTSCFSIVFYLLGRSAEIRIFRKEALAVIGLGWLLACTLGALPYVLILEECSVSDAIFESTSGITTTGASVFTGFEAWPRSLLFWRCLSQWMGGLGVVVFFVAVLGSLGASGKILFSNESSGTSTEIESGRFQSGVIQIMYLYLALSGLCVLSLNMIGLGWYDAVCHTFTTISTGGYSTRSASIEAFQNPTLEWVMILFMFLGGTSFILMLRVIKRDIPYIRRNSEFPVYIMIILGATLLIFLERIMHSTTNDLHELIRISMFQVVSILTTSGFSSADFGQWFVSSEVILLALMLTGGCTGSTAGGIKILRTIIALRISKRNIEKAFRTNVVRTIKINGTLLKKETEDQVGAFLILTMIILVTATVSISFLEQSASLETACSVVFSTLMNIGPGFDQIGPTGNYGFLHNYTKLILSLLMIMGRLELFAILVLFSPSLWKRFS